MWGLFYLRLKRKGRGESVAEENLLRDISQKLTSIRNLLIAGVIDGKRQTEQIRLLSFAGLQPKEIAEILGTTPNTVRVALARFRQ